MSGVPGMSHAHTAGVREWAVKNDLVAEVYVFGSRATGAHRTDSDVDLAIRIAPTENQTADGIAIACRKVWEAELQALLPYRVELQCTQPDTGEEIVWPAVEREGIRLYPTPSI